MQEKKIKNTGHGRIFDNAFLEYLTKAPPQISAITYISIGLIIFTVGIYKEVVPTIGLALFIFITAVFFWTFFEYFFHRYVNHIDEHFPNSAWAVQLAYTLHGVHHEYPRDKERLIMPPVPGLLILIILYVLFYGIMGNFLYLFMPGFITGYLLYTYIHFSVHKRKVPGYLKTQYRHHALHHYKYPDKAFGVSVTWWDRVFGTMPPED